MQAHANGKPIAISIAIFAVTLIAALLVRTVMQAPRPTAPPAPDAADHSAHADHDSPATDAVHDAHDSQRHAPANADSQGAAHPTATDAVPVRNAVCPVMGNEIDPEAGMEFNGWWVSFCCPPCEEDLTADPDTYAAKLLAQTGIDIRQAPTAADRRFSRGPEGSFLLGNKKCPVMGGTVNPEVGANVNGWWVHFCCGGCDEDVLADPAGYAKNLFAQTGIDILQSPAKLAAKPILKAGPNGTIALGNTTCPVTGEPVAAAIGIEVNGWWIGLSAPACIEILAHDLATFAPALKAHTDVDVRLHARTQPQTPRIQPSQH